MELFVVKNTKGVVVVKDQASKSLAKAERDRLQTEHGKMPEKDKRDIQSMWNFFVSKGKDHAQMA